MSKTRSNGQYISRPSSLRPDSQPQQMTEKRSLCTRTCDKFIGKPAPTPRGQSREGRTCSRASRSPVIQQCTRVRGCDQWNSVQWSSVLFRVQCFLPLFLVQRTSLILLMFRFIFRNTFRVASGSESFYQSVSVLSRVGTGSKRTGLAFIRARLGICLIEIV